MGCLRGQEVEGPLRGASFDVRLRDRPPGASFDAAGPLIDSRKEAILGRPETRKTCQDDIRKTSNTTLAKDPTICRCEKRRAGWTKEGKLPMGPRSV